MNISILTCIGAFSLIALASCGKTPEPAKPAVTENISAPPAAAPSEPSEPSLEFAGLPAPYNTASYSIGNRTWKLCQSCHLTAEGAGNMVGPNLHGLFGRQVATADGFDYSPALKAETFIWTPEQLDHWLANPKTFVPGNRMSFSGVRKPEDRIAVIAYLMTQTGYTAPAEAPAD